jgi:hypothetical protein
LLWVKKDQLANRKKKGSSGGRPYARSPRTRDYEPTQVCTWCGLALPRDLGTAHLDHVVPVIRGGPSESWNFQALHDAYNLAKHDTITPRALELAAEHGIALPVAARRANGAAGGEPYSNCPVFGQVCRPVTAVNVTGSAGYCAVSCGHFLRQPANTG